MNYKIPIFTQDEIGKTPEYFPQTARFANTRFGRYSTLMGVNMLGRMGDEKSGMGFGVQEAIADLTRAKNALIGYGPMEAIKALLNPAIAARLGGVGNGPRQLIPYWQGRMTQNAGGDVLTRSTVQPLTPDKKNPPLASIVTRRTVT